MPCKSVAQPSLLCCYRRLKHGATWFVLTVTVQYSFILCVFTVVTYTITKSYEKCTELTRFSGVSLPSKSGMSKSWSSSFIHSQHLLQHVVKVYAIWEHVRPLSLPCVWVQFPVEFPIGYSRQTNYCFICIQVGRKRDWWLRHISSADGSTRYRRIDDVVSVLRNAQCSR